MNHYRIDKRWPVAVVLLGAALSIALGACAKREAEDTTRLEQMALDAWIAKYVNNDGVKAVRQSNGMWVQFLEDGDQTIDAGRDTTVWVKLDYTSTDVNGNVFATRDSLEALRQRTYTPHTYYTPDYIYCDEWNTWGMFSGQYFALTSDLVKPDDSTVKLSEGSHVKLYIPSYLALGSATYTNDQGYGGQFPLGSNRIMIHDLEVKAVVKNPLQYEEKLVEKYATEQWGLSLADTVAIGLYVDTVNFRPRADLLEMFPNKDFIKEYGLTMDSTATIWFVGKFLPSPEYPEGFIFDTNIPAVYEKFANRRIGENYIPQERTLSALSYKPAENPEDETAIAAFRRTIPKLRRGLWSRIVFPSSYGYGATGHSKALEDQEERQAQVLNMYAYSSMYSDYGGYGGYGGYGDYYGSGYGSYGSYGYDPYASYLAASMSTLSQSEDQQTVITEILPYTPLVFEIYIEATE